MKLKALFLSVFILISHFPAIASADITEIRQRNYIICGTNTEYKSLALLKKNEWQGFDADICRALSTAIFGNAQNFKMLSVKTPDIGKFLGSGKIDVMLGNTTVSAPDEYTKKIAPAEILYYDRQIFASRKPTQASSMIDFKGSKVCVLRNSPHSATVSLYNQKHALELKLLELPTLASLKEAFYTNRCELISGSEIYLNHLITDIQTTDAPQILPEEISYNPVKIYVSHNSPKLNIITKWVINALKVASDAEMTSQNINIFASTKDESLQNILGTNPKFWQSMGLQDIWAKKYISQYGNYEQIIDRHIGEGSSLQLKTPQNKTVKKGGILLTEPFI